MFWQTVQVTNVWTKKTIFIKMVSDFEIEVGVQS